MGRLSTTSVRDGFWDRLGGQDGVCWSWSVFQKLKKTLDDACWIKQYLQFDACLIFLLSVATILNLPACTQKIPEPLGRPSFLLLFSACELVSQIPRLLPSVDSDEHSLRRRTSPIGSSNPPFFPPPPTPTLHEKSQTDDVLLYTASDWLLFGKFVFPRYDQRWITRIIKTKKPKKYRSGAIQKIYDYTYWDFSQPTSELQWLNYW